MRSRASGANGVVVEVADEGPGVADEIAPVVFERNVTGGDGSGLGLSLARDLAAADGGRLSLAQRRPPVFALFLSDQNIADGQQDFFKLITNGVFQL